MVFSAGNKGKSVRSDCFVQISEIPGKETVINLKSKVKALFGDDIKGLCNKVLRFYNIKNVLVEIDDSGALPFVIAARLEAVIKKYIITDKNFFFPLISQNKYKTEAGKNRRARLYLPGNNPKLMVNSGIYGSDAIILDLEDSVSPEKKDEARLLVRNALCQSDFYGAERMVRINQYPQGLNDLEYIVPFNVNTVVIPKCEKSAHIQEIEKKVETIAGTGKHGVYFLPIIETALGVENAFEVAMASPNNIGLSIGLEDYTANIGVQRTNEGQESLYARMRIVNAAVAAGIQALDSVFSEFENLSLLRQNALASKQLGFNGMGCIHPAQVKVVQDVFIPSENEIEKAKQIAYAFFKAQDEGKNVIAVGTKMVDPPVVKRALKIINEAVTAGKLNKEWRDNYEG